MSFDLSFGGLDFINVRQARDHAAENVFFGHRTEIVTAKIARISSAIPT